MTNYYFSARIVITAESRVLPVKTMTQFDWDIVLWAKMHGPSSTAFTELLQIPKV
jgi:hypothetical protein